MDIDEFKKSAHEFIDWIVEYYKNIETYPVKSQVKPHEIFNKLPDNPPMQAENIEKIFSDFQNIIIRELLTGKVRISSLISLQTQVILHYWLKCLHRLSVHNV